MAWSACFLSLTLRFAPSNFARPMGATKRTSWRIWPERRVSYRAITRGEHPIIYRTPEGTGEMAIESVEVVDTLGAGDILHGAFCYYSAKGNTFVSALLQASRIATLSCQTFGTRSWMKR